MARFPRNDIISLIGEMPRYDLGESIGPDLRLGDVLDPSAQRSLGEIALGYGTAQGDPRLRALIARAHDVAPDDVVLTVGGMHALFLIAFVLCNRGDEAVTVSPMFPLARNTLEAVGAQIRTVSLSFDRGYQLDAADIGRHLTERTKLVSLASPQNPSGVASSPNVIRDIVSLMEERSPEAYLALDETYREAAYGDDAVAPSAVALIQVPWRPRLTARMGDHARRRAQTTTGPRQVQHRDLVLLRGRGARAADPRAARSHPRRTAAATGRGPHAHRRLGTRE